MNEEIELDEVAPWIILILTLMGGFLRVFLLDDKGLWLDETFSLWLAKHSLVELLQWTVKIDPHPPLYYLLLHYWMAFLGETPYAVRLLSALLGAGSIPVIYLIGKRLSGAVVGLAAAVLLALSPFNIYFAQETRMYTCLAFNAALAIYALTRLLTDPRSVRPIGSQFQAAWQAWRSAGPKTGRVLTTIETDLAWVAFIVFSAAALWTHNTAVFLPLAANLYLLGLFIFQRFQKADALPALQAPSGANWLKAQLGIFLLWSPWLPSFLQQVRRVEQEFWLPRPDWETVLQTLRAFLNASAQNQASQLVTWFFCAVLGLGLVFYRKKLSSLFFLLTLFAVPVLGELLVSLHRPIFYGRTLIWVTIPLLLLLAAGIAQLRFRFLMVMVLGLLGTNYLFSAGDYFRFAQKEDWATAAGYVANFAQKDDLILFNSNFVVIPFDYYFQPYVELYAIQVEQRGVPLDLFTDGVLEPKMTESARPGLVALLRGHQRVWLVYSHDSYTDPDGLIPQTLAAQSKLIQERDFYGGKVQLYAAP